MPADESPRRPVRSERLVWVGFVGGGAGAGLPSFEPALAAMVGLLQVLEGIFGKALASLVILTPNVARHYRFLFKELLGRQTSRIDQHGHRLTATFLRRGRVGLVAGLACDEAYT